LISQDINNNGIRYKFIAKNLLDATTLEKISRANIDILMAIKLLKEALKQKLQWRGETLYLRLEAQTREAVFGAGTLEIMNEGLTCSVNI
jgi:hypothetical protein